MINEQKQQQLMDYLEGNLSEKERESLQQEIANNTALQTWIEQMQQLSSGIMLAKELKPSAALRDSFHAALQQEIEAQQKTKTIYFTPTLYRVAAAFIAMLALAAVGFWVNNQWKEREEMAQLREELQETKRMMMAMMNNELSASQRMMGVSVAYNMEKSDDEIINALIKVLNEDPNTNVRLSALDALSKFYKEPAVKNALIQSLTVQKDPSVQIALIQLLVQIKEGSIVPQLKNMIEDQQSIKAVRDEAHTALLKLS